jgi:hypothetical protein
MWVAVTFTLPPEAEEIVYLPGWDSTVWTRTVEGDISPVLLHISSVEPVLRLGLKDEVDKADG